MGEPILSNIGISRHEFIVAGGKRGELKHLSTFRKINQLTLRQAQGHPELVVG